MEKHEQRVEANQESQEDPKGEKDPLAEIGQEPPRFSSPVQIPHKPERAHSGKDQDQVVQHKELLDLEKVE